MRAQLSLYQETPAPLHTVAPSPMSEPPRSDFGSFYRATLAPLRRYLARMLGNPTDAQDVAQDA